MVETDPNSGSTDHKQTRCERYFYLGTQAALVVITGVGIAIAICTLKSLDRSVKAAKRAAEAAKASADAELASVRAWQVPADIRLPAVTSLKPGAPFTVDFQNSGKTPALDPILTEEFKFWKHGEPPIRFRECASSSPKDQPGTFRFGTTRPGQEAGFTTHAFDLTLSTQQIGDLKAHQAAIMIHVCMWYGVVPPGQPSGVTDYCTVAYVLDEGTLPCPYNRSKIR